jgi:hypothetical protein
MGCGSGLNGHRYIYLIYYHYAVSPFPDAQSNTAPAPQRAWAAGSAGGCAHCAHAASVHTRWALKDGP